MKLLRVYDSAHKGKKLCAEFEQDDGRITHTNFGASGYRDFTTIENRDEAEVVRARYWTRHQKEVGNALDSPGMLSLFILWGWYQNRRMNIARYKKLFNI